MSYRAGKFQCQFFVPTRAPQPKTSEFRTELVDANVLSDQMIHPDNVLANDVFE